GRGRDGPRAHAGRTEPAPHRRSGVQGACARARRGVPRDGVRRCAVHQREAVTHVTVLDFGMGNLRSVAKALEKVGASVEVASEVDASADALVVPGQGAFGSCVLNLGPRMEDVRAWISSGRPYLGICLGLQVLFDSSEE